MQFASWSDWPINRYLGNRSSSARRDTLYLNVGLMFSVLWIDLVFDSACSDQYPGDVGWQAYSTIVYLSFVTLTLFD